MKECEEIVKHRIIAREQKGKKISLLNEIKEKVKVVEVDGCAIIEGNRCDWLFVQMKPANEIFVELKGSDITHACLQLETTIQKMTMKLDKDKFAIVVCGRVSPSINTTIQNLKKKFKKKMKASLIIRQDKCCFDLSKLKEIDCSKI